MAHVLPSASLAFAPKVSLRGSLTAGGGVADDDEGEESLFAINGTGTNGTATGTAAGKAGCCGLWPRGGVVCCGRRWGGGGGFGAHDIGFLGGLCLMSNNICGSAMVQLPGLNQQAGWVGPTLAFILVAAATTMSALLLARAIASLPGNARFGQRWEMGRVAQELLPRWAYLVTVFFLVASFIAQNISNIIVSAQSWDGIFLAAGGHTCALQMYPPTGGSPMVCIDGDNDNVVTDSPFGADAYVISAGYLLVLVATVPLSYLNLDDNIWVQVGGMALLVACVVVWVAQFIGLGLSSALMPPFATTASGGPTQYTSVLPTVLFNYGFVATTPSWLNEKSASTSTTRTLLASVGLATFLYLALGLFGGLSLAAFGTGADVLSVILEGGVPGMWEVSRVAAYVFPIVNLMASIPVFAVIVRYNLVNTGWLPVWAANLVAVGAPWALSLVFYAGNQLTDLINWSSALLFVPINLLIPVALYLASRAAAPPARAAVTDAAWSSSLSDTFTGGSAAGSGSGARRGVKEALLADTGDVGVDADADGDDSPPEDIHAVPAWWMACLPERTTARALFGFSILLGAASLGLQIYSQQQAGAS